MMKKLLFILCISLSLSLSAQTTHNLNWFTGIGSSVDLTIAPGDTVIWTWTSPNHDVTSAAGSTETFGSGFLAANGSTFSHTFTLVGANPYLCTIHGANSMSGTITVQTLSTPEFDTPTKFSIYPNPSSDVMNINIPTLTDDGLTLEVFDVLGKKVYSQQISELSSKVNIGEWNSGLYLVRLSSPNQDITLTKRFVKL